MAFTNLLTAVYPVGSLYLSTSSVSPATLIGGTWTQIKGAVLGFTGSNSFSGAASYGGKLAIAASQLPPHTHKVYMWNDASGAYWNAAFGGGGGAAQLSFNWTGDTTSGLVARENTGGGQNFLPYHFAVYGWYRTA